MDTATSRATNETPHLAEKVQERAHEVKRAYAGERDRPLAGYAAAVAAYAGLATAAGVFARRRRVALPERIPPQDLAVIGIATHKLSRMIAKDPILSPLRAPFTRFRGTSGEAELAEEVRGEGTRHAVGELISCPFCLAQWVATGFVAGMIFAPRATRLVAATLSAKAISDLGQFVYDAAQQRASGD